MNLSEQKVMVVGLGYIGLPTAAVLANAGYDVLGLEINSEIVEVVNRGEIHIVEPDLDALVHEAVNSKRLRASTKPEPADIILIAVPTPFKDDHKPDIRHIHEAAKSISPYLQPGTLIILESTSPVGTTECLSTWMAELRSDLTFPTSSENPDINVAYCPERVLPGNIVGELIKNDRVIGGLTAECAERARSFYMSFVKGECVKTNAKTAEMTKLTENSFRDLNIAFANELSMICDELGINTWELISLANRHPRVNILNPGPGVGGHCIAVDPWFIVDSAPGTARLIRTAREVNNKKPEWVINKIIEAADKIKLSKNNPVIACLGLAFKANIDDLRESPSLDIVEQLAQKQVTSQVLVVEPFIDRLPDCLKAEHYNIKLVDAVTAIHAADIVVLLVDHSQLINLDKTLLSNKIVIDTRGAWK